MTKNADTLADPNEDTGVLAKKAVDKTSLIGIGTGRGKSGCRWLKRTGTGRVLLTRACFFHDGAAGAMDELDLGQWICFRNIFNSQRD